MNINKSLIISSPTDITQLEDTIGKIDERNEWDWQISTFDIRVGREIVKRGKYVIIVPKHLEQKDWKSNHISSLLADCKLGLRRQ